MHQMNTFVESEYDSFEMKREIKLREFIYPSIISNTLELQNIAVTFFVTQVENRDPEIVLFVGYQSPTSSTEIQELFIKFNGKELTRIERLSSHNNSVACYITLEELKKICDAQIAEIRIKNKGGHTDFSSNTIKYGACAIYNALIDENAYIEEIQNWENEIAEKDKIAEQELSEVIARENRIKNRGVNKFFSVEYDKFKQKLTVEQNKEIELETLDGTLIVLKPKISFRYVRVGDTMPILLMDLDAISKTDLNLKNGECLLILDDKKRLTLQPEENYSKPYLEKYTIESERYEIDEDSLLAICNARVIEMRITNGDGYADISTLDLQLAARRFYNAVIDDTAYSDDLLTHEEREAAERERIRKENEAKEAEEARKRAQKRAAWWAANKKKVSIAALTLIGIIAAIIGIKIIANAISEKKTIADANNLITQGEQLLSTYHFDEAYEMFDKARKMTDDMGVRYKAAEGITQIGPIRNKVNAEYDNALKNLKVLMDADNNEFNELSNAFLDKMIGIYPNRQETKDYKNMRAKQEMLIAVPDYEHQGDELFESGQYEQALRKYQASEVQVRNGGQHIPKRLKDKEAKSQKCKTLLSQATSAKEENRYEEASNLFNELYSLHKLTSYKTEANTLKHKAKTTLIIPNSIQKISDRQYAGRSYITTVVFHNNVTSIGHCAFSDCYNITSLIIPKNVSSIGVGPFRGCYGIKSIKVDPNNAVYDSRNNCNAIIKTATNELVQGCKNTIIPSNIKIIGNRAFSEHTDLHSINIPNGVISIEDFAFSTCRGLKSVTIPNSVTSIGAYAFTNCNSLTSLTLPNSIMSIGEHAFSGCSNLNLKLPARFKNKVSGCKSVTYY